jgi:integrase
MRLYKRGAIWWADFGRNRRESAGTDDKAQAKQWAQHRAVELWESEKLGVSHHSWREAMVAYLNERAHLRSLNDQKDRLRWLDHRLCQTPIRAITQHTVEQLITELQATRAPATVNRYMAALGAVLRVAQRKGWTTAVPHIRKLKERNQRTRWITPEQAADLLRELPPHLNTMAAFALMTGLRASNIQYLQWDQVSIERRVAWVAADDFKSGKAHTVPLNDDAITILKNQRTAASQWVFPYSGKPVAKVSTKAWHNACTRAGLTDLHFHDLRHTWASWHVMRGTPLQVLMELGGWSSLDMVLRYAHLAPGHNARFADALCGSQDKITHREKSSDERAAENSNETSGLVGWLTGLEPATTGITNRSGLTHVCKLLIIKAGSGAKIAKAA